MIQITPQMRIVAAIEPVDFRCGWGSRDVVHQSEAPSATTASWPFLKVTGAR